MNIFYEIYGAYFRTAEKILSKAFQCGISEKDIYNTVQTEAFRDSLLFIPQKIIPDKNGNSDWGLLKRNGSLFISATKNPPPKFVTALQKSWIKAKLSDPKFRLFFTDDVLSALEKDMEDIKPLFLSRDFKSFDVFADGDDFLSESYGENFRAVVSAIKKREIISIGYRSGKNNFIRGRFLPLKLEYSRKNDKFRLYCLRVKRDRKSGADKIGGRGIFNLGRVTELYPTGVCANITPDMREYFRAARCCEPVQIEVSDERNGIERFMVEFASFEKRVEFDPDTGKCAVSIWYDKADETELLIRLLGFGPVVKILGPKDFRRQATRRVKAQYELLFSGKSQELIDRSEVFSVT